MKIQQNMPQPPETWMPGTIATALIAAVLAVGVAIGEASTRNGTEPGVPAFAPTELSVSPATAEPWAVFVDSELPVAYVRQPSGDWKLVRQPDGSQTVAASGN